MFRLAPAAQLTKNNKKYNLNRVTRPTRGGETKAFYKTTEFVVFIVATIAVLLASFFVKAADGHADYFAADKAWLYVVILSVGYIITKNILINFLNFGVGMVRTGNRAATSHRVAAEGAGRMPSVIRASQHRSYRGMPTSSTSRTTTCRPNERHHV